MGKMPLLCSACQLEQATGTRCWGALLEPRAAFPGAQGAALAQAAVSSTLPS